MTYGPAKALPSTISWSGVSAVAEKTSSSTIGPAGLDRICGNVWSLPLARLNTTVVGSGASTPARLASSAAGPVGAVVATIPAKVKFTSDEGRSGALGEGRAGFRV